MLRVTFFFAAVALILLTAGLGLAQTTTPSPAKQARQILEQGLADGNPEKRKEAVVALSLASVRNNVLPLLDTALGDKDVEVRLAACASVAALRDKQAIPLLERALKDEVPEVSFAAAKGLWEMNNPDGREVLLAVLAKERKTSSNFITKERRDAMRMMKNPGGLFRYAVKAGLGMAPIPGLGIGMASLEALLSDSGVSGRALVALLLAKDKDPESFEALRGALSDDDWSVRAAAVHSIALDDRPEALGDLVPLLEDKKPAVRYRAAVAYMRLELIGKDRKGGAKKAAARGARIRIRPSPGRPAYPGAVQHL